MVIRIKESELKKVLETTICEFFERIIPMDDYYYNIRPYINEGLTCTYNIKKVMDILKRKYDFKKYGIKIGSFDNNPHSKNLLEPLLQNYDKVEDTDNWYHLTLIFINGLKGNKEIVKDIIHTCDVCGWYLSDCAYNIRKDLNNELVVKNSKTLNLDDAILTNTPFVLRFRAKFNTEYKEKSVPGHLYHIAPLRVLEKIKKQGLTPRNNGRIASHPERVYLFIDYPDNWREIADNFRMSNRDEEYFLLKIDKTKLNPNTKFYFDSNIMSDNKAIYTYEPIPFVAISVAERENFSKS